MKKKQANFGKQFKNMKFPKKIETAEDIEQAIDAYKYRYLFKQMRKDPTMVFEFFQAGAASRMPFVNLDIDWYYKLKAQIDGDAPKAAYDDEGHFANRWKKVVGENRYDNAEIDLLRKRLIWSNFRRHSQQLNTSDVSRLKKLLSAANKDVKEDRPNDSDDSGSCASIVSGSSEESDEQSAVPKARKYRIDPTYP